MLRNAPRHARITVNPDVMGGKPCIKGTCIPVDLIVEKLDHGQSSEEILKACPDLTLEDVRAAESYARAVPQSRLDAVIAHFDPPALSLFCRHRQGDGAALR